MNPRLAQLHPYPFERLRALLARHAAPSPGEAVGAVGGAGAGVGAVAGDHARRASPPPQRAVNLSIGEPRHETPEAIKAALAGALDGLSSYPATAGTPALRQAIAAWIGRRHGVAVDAQTEVLPVNGSREALFAFAQTVIDPTNQPVVVAPNPFYQIYEGAALLAGARVHLVDQSPANDLRCDWDAVPQDVWRRTQLVFVCSPGNPTGAVMPLAEWQQLFELSDRHGFVIASDECYSEIYPVESQPPLGGLAASEQLGRQGHRRLVVFSSLSKRSSVPGMRSGFVAGDAALVAAFLQYRTYHGSAMSPAVQAASIAAWEDEAHVIANRRLYREKFDAVVPLLQEVVPVRRPEGGFYLWLPVPGGDDCGFTWRLNHEFNTLVLPGSFLGRDSAEAAGGAGGESPDGVPAAGTALGNPGTASGNRGTASGNPGAGFVRIALVADLEACVEGVRRIRRLLEEIA